MTDTHSSSGHRFIGRHTVSDPLANDYEVGMLNRGTRENPFSDDDRVTHVEGDRKNDRDLRTAKLSIEPDIVIDCVAYHPDDERWRGPSPSTGTPTATGANGIRDEKRRSAFWV